jgi:hypothetical protein
MWFKSKAPVLGDFEQLVLLGVLRLELEDSAYGAAIRQEIHARSRRDVSINAVYTAGVAALRQAYRAFTAMADGLQNRLELK